MLNTGIYVCQNPGKKVSISMQQKQLEIRFSYAIPEQDELNRQDLISSLYLMDTAHRHLHFRGEQSQSMELPRMDLPLLPDHLALDDPPQHNYTYVAIQVYDAETYQSIGGALINVYLNILECTLLDSTINYSIRYGPLLLHA